MSDAEWLQQHRSGQSKIPIKAPAIATEPRAPSRLSVAFGQILKKVGKLATQINTLPDFKPKPKTYPLMTWEMIGSNGQPINTVQAVKLFKLFMLRSGFLQQDELTEHAGYFADEIRSHTEALAEDLASARHNLKTCDPEDKASNKEAVEDARLQLADFRADKRQFLITYVNRQIQSN